jgi:hypothetical protein
MVGYRQHDKFDLHHDMGTYDEKTRQVEAVSPRRLVTFFLVRQPQHTHTHRHHIQVS